MTVGPWILTFYVIPQRPVSIRMLAEVCQINILITFSYPPPINVGHHGRQARGQDSLGDCHDSGVLTFYVIPQRPVPIRMLVEVCQN
jgi:hypothetical protein